MKGGRLTFCASTTNFGRVLLLYTHSYHAVGAGTAKLTQQVVTPFGDDESLIHTS